MPTNHPNIEIVTESPQTPLQQTRQACTPAIRRAKQALTGQINAAKAQLMLWQLLGMLVIAATVFCAFITGISVGAADVPTLLVFFFFLLTPPAGTLTALSTGHRRLAVYSSIPGVVTSAAACYGTLLTFFIASPPSSPLLQLLFYPSAVILALPFAYASLIQLRIALAILVTAASRRQTLSGARATPRLKP